MKKTAAATREYTLIDPSEKRIFVELRELANYRDLIILFVKRGFMVKYAQTVLGPIWIILQPFITSMVYLFVFGGIAKIDTNGIPGILFYTGSNAIWVFFSSTLTSNAHTFTGNAHLFGKVYFPRLTVPIANMISSGIRYFIEMILFAALYVWFASKGRVSGSAWFFPVLILVMIQLGLLGLGCGTILSSLTVKYRDLNVIVGFGIQLWMYVTPIVYPLSNISNNLYRTLILINPATAPIELYRRLLFHSGEFNMLSYSYSWVITLAVLFLGIKLFSHVEKTFIDTV